MADDATRPQARLGGLVRRRREELGMSIPIAAQQAEIDRETWRNLEAGKRRPRGYNRTRIERTLRWKAGSIEAMLDGGEPVPLDPGNSHPEPAEPRRYYHPELGEIVHEQDVQLWEATTFDQDTRVGFIFQARARRMREEGENGPQRLAG